MLFQTASVIESIATRVDGSIKIVVGTQELPPEQAVELFRLKGQQGWLLFKDSPVESSEVPNEPLPDLPGDKTPSQRLKSVLYKFWELNTDKRKTFDNFYRDWVEKKIAEVKDYLPK